MDSVEIHVFGDASPQGYGANVYLRIVKGEDCETALVMSKARVAPIKRVSLPRLELLGSLLAAKLLGFVRNALRLSVDTSYCCWTDSTIALSWIKGDPCRWKQFVSNRISSIQE